MGTIDVLLRQRRIGPRHDDRDQRRKKPPPAVPKSTSLSIATSGGRRTFIRAATILIADRKHADQPTANIVRGFPVPGATRSRKPDIEASIRGARAAFISAPSRVRSCRIENFFDWRDVHRLLTVSKNPYQRRRSARVI